MSTTQSPKILITGATGSIGTELAQQLAAQRISFRVMVRSLENTQQLSRLAGAEIVTGDFNNTPSIQQALNGIEHAFLLTNSSEQAETLQSNFVEVAAEAGLPHLVKLSQWEADIHSPVRFLRYHAAVEQKIQQSGIAYTFLRPNLFMQGLLGFRELIANTGKFFASVGEATISAIDIRDIAAVALTTLTSQGHEGKIYNLTGPEALTHQQMAHYLAQALDRPVQFVHVTPADMRQALLSVGFPEWQTEGLIEDYAHYARGEASQVSPDVERVTGKAARTFETFAQDYAPVFSGK